MHTDIGHDSIPSRISVYIYIYIYVSVRIYANIYTYIRRGERCMSRILLNPSSSRTSPPSPFPARSSFSKRPNIPRNTPLYRAASKGERTRNFYTRVAVPHHENRLTSNRFPLAFPSSPTTAEREDARMRGPFDLFAGTFISATGHRLPPLICKYSLTVIKDTLARPPDRFLASFPYRGQDL